MRKQHVLQFCYGLAIILHRMTGLICKILFKSNIKGKKKRTQKRTFDVFNVNFE